MNPETRVHFPHPDDPNRNLCGCACTRFDPQTTDEDGDNVDCLSCLVLNEDREKAEL